MADKLTDTLTEVLMDQLQRQLGLPLKDGLQIRINPLEQSVWVGYRKSW